MTIWKWAYVCVICFGCGVDVWLELLERATVGCNDLIRSICVYKWHIMNNEKKRDKNFLKNEAKEEKERLQIELTKNNKRRNWSQPVHRTNFRTNFWAKNVFGHLSRSFFLKSKHFGRKIYHDKKFSDQKMIKMKSKIFKCENRSRRPNEKFLKSL